MRSVLVQHGTLEPIRLSAKYITLKIQTHDSGFTLVARETKEGAKEEPAQEAEGAPRKPQPRNKDTLSRRIL